MGVSLGAGDSNIFDKAYTAIFGLKPVQQDLVGVRIWSGERRMPHYGLNRGYIRSHLRQQTEDLHDQVAARRHGLEASD
jgi:hypothetical protein